MDVLVFRRGWEVHGAGEGGWRGVDTSGTEISFSIRLDATSKRRVIHLVPNGRTPDGVTDRLNFGDITPTMTESAAMLALKTSTFAGTLVVNDAFDHVGTCGTTDGN